METIKILLGIVIIAIEIFSPCIIYALWVMDKIKNIEEEDRKGEIRIMDNRTIEEVRRNETKLINEIKVLEQQCKKQKEVIDKAIEYIEKESSFLSDDEYELFNKKELLQILEKGDSNE